MGNIGMFIQLLLVIADAVPRLAPKIADMFEMMKGEPVTDITQEEFEQRIDAAIAKLPVWE
jgi:hypothetical protein